VINPTLKKNFCLVWHQLTSADVRLHERENYCINSALYLHFF
jgi:hypothetical protein